MATRNFHDLLQNQWSLGHFVCIGLDSNFEQIPLCARGTTARATVLNFNRAIVEATKDLVCAYKPNSAFYEKLGANGLPILHETIAFINRTAPKVPIILDCKRADIGNTSEYYACAAFNFLKADAITVNPYLGGEALRPFLNRHEKGVFILCRTSNKDAGEFQDLLVLDKKSPSSPPKPLYQVVAKRVSTDWNTKGNCGLVVGATSSQELAQVRNIVGDLPILIPGIGTQGGDIQATVAAGKNSHGQGMIINSSRGIIFASREPDFAEVARRKTQELHNLVNLCLKGKQA